MSSDLTTINITGCDERYDELVDRINAIVQLMINFDPKAQLPNKLVMTKRQKKMLRRYEMMQQMMGTDNRVWVSPHNAMEVIIVA